MSQAITHSGAANRRFRIDLKRVSGSDPLQVTLDGGVTWTNFVPVGGYLNWSHHATTVQNLAASDVRLRSKAGNSFIIDFVQLWSDRDNGGSTLPLSGRLSSKTLIGRDRLHHNIGTVGGTSGTEGINLVRSMVRHGLFCQFGNQNSNYLVAVVTGINITLDRATQTIGVSSGGVKAPVPIDPNGDGSVMNKMMYYRDPSELRVAVNGALYRTTAPAVVETTTHDFAVNGSGAALDSFVRRTVWYDGSRLPTDAEMVAWTA